MLFWICQEPSGPYLFLNIQELRGEARLSQGSGIQAFLITVISTLFLFMSHVVKGDCLQLSFFDRDHLMFCKSGILIFIFAENNHLSLPPSLPPSLSPSLSLLSLSLRAPGAYVQQRDP